MSMYKTSQEIMKSLKSKVLGGSKIPHSTSFPVLRRMGNEYRIVFFLQLTDREQLKKGLIQRPTYWYSANIEDGSDFHEYESKKEEFSKAPYDRVYERGTPASIASKTDVEDLYTQLDLIRKHYINDGILDAFAYKNYLNDLFKYIPNGQIAFYKELSKLS